MDRTAEPSTSRALLRGLIGPESEAAWRRFVGRYRPVIAAHCRRARLSDEDADEVTARVLTKLVSALRKFEYDPQRRFRGYLARAVANTIRTYWRERRQPGAGSGGGQADAVLESVAAPLQELAEELDVSVRGDLDRLEQVMAQVRERVEPATWQMYYETAVEGHDSAAVAARLGKSVSAVYMAKSRVAALLRKAATRMLLD